MNIFEETLNIELEKTSKHILNFPFEDKWLYALWLAQTYNMVNYSSRLVALAGGLSSLKNEQLHTTFVNHSHEERGHQFLCLKDLKAIGFDHNELPVTSQSSSLYQTQYYWITQVCPASFMGYVLALEALACHFGKDIFLKVKDSHGPKAAHFLRVHAEDDIEHVKSGLKVVNSFNEFELASATKNLENSSNTYRYMLTNIKSIKTNKKNIAA